MSLHLIKTINIYIDICCPYIVLSQSADKETIKTDFLQISNSYFALGFEILR